MTIKYCEFCANPLEKKVTESGKEYFFCCNTVCQAQRLSRIESRLESIERLLTPIPVIEEKFDSKSSSQDIPITPKKDPEATIVENISILPTLSLKEGKSAFYSLLNLLDGSRGKLYSLLEEVANQKYFSLRFLHQWAILMAYSGKPFLAAQKVLQEGAPPSIPFLQEVITRANSVRTSEKDPTSQFFSSLLLWAKRENLSTLILNDLQAHVTLLTPPITVVKKPKVRIVEDSPPKHPIDSSQELYIPSPTPSWLDRFRPKEGWEFAIGANWLRWIGIGAILFSIFALITWSSTQLHLTEEEMSMVIFVGLFLVAFIFHLSSFWFLRSRGQNRYIPSIASSLAFLANGIYFLLLFALRFHPSSPVIGDDQFYFGLCLLVILSVGITAQNHNSTILFLQGFLISIWLIWHLSSQLYAETLSTFTIIRLSSAEIFGFIWICFAIFLLVFLGVAFLRKDMFLTACIQLLSLSLLFLPNSSNLLSSHLITEDINAMMVLLIFIIVTFLFTSFIFPLAISNQFFDLFTREHLSITSVTPVFVSFFLLSLGSISGTVFLPLILIFSTAFISLAFRQKDLGVAFLIVLLAQIFWFFSIGLSESITFVFSDLSGTLVVLLYLTIFNWLVAREFPSDVQPRFWEFVSRKHLTLTALGPIFISFFLNILGFVTNTIFVIYLILFCILWSSNSDTTVDISSLSVKNVSMFDFVIYLSTFLFLLIMILQPGDDLIGLILGFIVFPFLLLISQKLSQISIDQINVKEIYAFGNSMFMALLFLILILKDSFTQLSDLNFSSIPLPVLQYGHNWAFLGFLWIASVLLITTKNFRASISHDISKLTLGAIPPLLMHFYLSLADISESIILLFVFASYIYVFVLYYIFESLSTQVREEGSSKSWFILPLLTVLQTIITFQQIRTDSPWNSIFVIYSILFCILWSSNRDTTVDISSLSVKKVSIFDFVIYLSTFFFLVTLILQTSNDLTGLILGFVAFPFLLLVSQNLSLISIDHKTVQEFYAFVNSVVMALLFLILVLKDSFTMLSDLAFSFIPLPVLHFDHNWAFVGFLWVVCVLLITTEKFRSQISQDKIKFCLGVIPPLITYFYLSIADITESMILVFVLVCYVHIFILYFLFDYAKTHERPETSFKSRFVLPLLAILQLIVSLQQKGADSPWNPLIVILVSLLLPFSLGFLLIIRKLLNTLINSYLIISTAIITIFQFSLLDSMDQSDAWLIHTIFLGFSLVYLVTHFYRTKDQLLATNKHLPGLNFLILSILGFINTIVCYSFFDSSWSPIMIFLFFDLLVLFSLVFALLLLRIERQVVVAIVLTLYGSSLLYRLQFIKPVPEFDFLAFLFLGFLIQVIIHGLLFNLSKTVLLGSPVLSNWHFDFTTRTIWNIDSFKVIAIINPLLFYYYLSELVIKSVENFEMTEFLPILMIVLAVVIGGYYVVITQVSMPRTVSDSGLFFSIIIVWGYTLLWSEVLEIFYFSAGTTAFLCILYGFWVIKREWRLVGLVIIGFSIVYSAVYLAQLTETLQTIVGFGLLGIISIIIGLVYSKFASRFEINESKISE